MVHFIDKDAVVAKIEKLISNGQTKLKESEECKDYESYVAWAERIATCLNVLSILDTLEVKEVEESKLPNPLFPHLDNIVDKVFGTGNLESFEYEEAKQLVLLAKEELLKDLEVKEVDLETNIQDYINSHFTEGEDGVMNSDYFTVIGGVFYKDLKEIAKHFFELGLKAQKGE